MLGSIAESVTGLFTSGDDDEKGPNAVDLLKTDHRAVEELFARVKANEDGDNTATFEKIKLELDTHAHIEESIFYPYLMQNGDEELKKTVREGLEEHKQVKQLLAELDTREGTSPTFKAKITVLMENVEHHVEEEEDEMFSMVEDQIEDETLERLGGRMQAEKQRFRSGSASSAAGS